jgi:hypothetical protein
MGVTVSTAIKILKKNKGERSKNKNVPYKAPIGHGRVRSVPVCPSPNWPPFAEPQHQTDLLLLTPQVWRGVVVDSCMLMDSQSDQPPGPVLVCI